MVGQGRESVINSICHTWVQTRSTCVFSGAKAEGPVETWDMVFSRRTTGAQTKPNQEAFPPGMVVNIPLAKASDMAKVKIPGAGRVGRGGGCTSTETSKF